MSYHKLVSYIKSVLRIIGFIELLQWFLLGVLILIIAEVLGILEEVREK